MPIRPAATVAALGSAQTLSWASTYYLPAMLAGPMARDLGVSVPMVFAAFSTALLVSALIGPRSGAAIDRLGGRPVLMATNVVFAIGLALLGLAQGAASLFAAWVIVGIGMGSGLYEAAFASLVRLYGGDSRSRITGITLIAGFASTVGWPVSSYLEAHFGWRTACFCWAGLHLVLGLPLNALLPRVTATVPAPAQTSGDAVSEPRGSSLRPTLLLAFVFAATGFMSTAMAAHLPRLLQAAGATLATAVLVGALIGPSQVGARLLEFGLLRSVHPLISARVATVLHPAGVLVLALFGAPAAAAFGILHGGGNGILTIVKGTLPLAIFGGEGYGRRQGLLMMPARVLQALAPWLFGLVIDRWGSGAFALSAGLGVLAFLALFGLGTIPRTTGASTTRPASP